MTAQELQSRKKQNNTNSPTNADKKPKKKNSPRVNSTPHNNRTIRAPIRSTQNRTNYFDRDPIKTSIVLMLLSIVVCFLTQESRISTIQENLVVATSKFEYYYNETIEVVEEVIPIGEQNEIEKEDEIINSQNENIDSNTLIPDISDNNKNSENESIDTSKVIYSNGELSYVISKKLLNEMVDKRIISSYSSQSIWDFLASHYKHEIDRLQIPDDELQSTDQLINEKSNNTSTSTTYSFSIFKLSTILYFVGAILCVSAFLFFALVGFLAFGGVSTIFFSSVAAYVIHTIALYLWNENNFIASSLLYLVLTSIFPVIMVGFLQMIRVWPNRAVFYTLFGRGRSIFVFLEVFTISCSLYLMKAIPFSFVSITFWLAFVYLLRDFPKLFAFNFRGRSSLFLNYFFFILLIYLYFHSCNSSLTPEEQIQSNYNLENIPYHSHIIDYIYSPLIRYFDHSELQNNSISILSNLNQESLSFADQTLQTQHQKLLGMIAQFSHNFIWWGVIFLSYSLTHSYYNVYQANRRNPAYLRSYLFSFCLSILLLFEVNLLFRFILIGLTFFALHHNTIYLFSRISERTHFAVCASLLFYLSLIHYLHFNSIIVIGKANFSSATSIYELIIAFLNRTPYNLTLSSICLNWFQHWFLFAVKPANRNFGQKFILYLITSTILPVCVFSFYPYTLFQARVLLPQFLSAFFTILLLNLINSSKKFLNYFVTLSIQFAILSALFYLFQVDLIDLFEYYYSVAVILFLNYAIILSLILLSSSRHKPAYSLLVSAFTLFVLSVHLHNLFLLYFIIPLLFLTPFDFFFDRSFAPSIKYIYLTSIALLFKLLVFPSLPYPPPFLSFTLLFKPLSDAFFSSISSFLNVYSLSPSSAFFSPVSSSSLSATLHHIFSLVGSIFLWFLCTYRSTPRHYFNLCILCFLFLFSFVLHDSLLLFLSSVTLLFTEIFEVPSSSANRTLNFNIYHSLIILGHLTLLAVYCFPVYFDRSFSVITEIFLFALTFITDFRYLKTHNFSSSKNYGEFIFPLISLLFYAFFTPIYSLGSLHYYYLLIYPIVAAITWPSHLLFFFTYICAIFQYSLGYYIGAFILLYSSVYGSRTAIVTISVVFLGITSQSSFVTISGAITLIVNLISLVVRLFPRHKGFFFPFALVIAGLGLVLVGVKYDDISQKIMEGRADLDIGVLEYIPTLLRSFNRSIYDFITEAHRAPLSA